MSDEALVHPSAVRVATLLRKLGVQGPFRQFDETTKSAAAAATVLGCEPGAIANSLVFILDDEPVVILKSGAFRVDLEQFAHWAGGACLRRADAHEVRAATGQSIGGVSPAGWPVHLRVFIDDFLAGYDRIWAACGTPNAVFATTYVELRDITKATPVTLHRS